jgi:D-amino-acid dehydrogenase
MLYRWLYRFIKNANHERVKKSVQIFEKYGKIAMDEYKAISQIPELDISYNDSGVMLVFTEKESFLRRKKIATDPAKYQHLTFDETKELLPFIKENIAGAMILKRNGYLDPVALMKKIKAYLQERGVEFLINTKITDIKKEQGRVTSLMSDDKEFKSDIFILSTGADLTLSKMLGRNFVMIPAKGHSITFEMDRELIPKKAAIFNDIFTFMTPYKDRVRLTSKLELNIKNNTPDPKMIEKIIKTFKEYTIDFKMFEAKIWAGNRPLTPNDMPLIGRDEEYENIIYATGLGWLGITFAPAIGKIITELIDKEQTNRQNDDIMLFSGFYQ